MTMPLGEIEKIGVEHVKWTAMIHGIDAMFVQVDSLIKKLNELEKEEEKDHA